MNIAFPFKNSYFPRKFIESASTRGDYLFIYLSICFIYIYIYILFITYIYIHIYIERERERVITMKKNYIFEKYFRLTSLSIHYIYISYTDETVHRVPKCMSCHKAIVVITGRAHCFHDYIYILRSSCFCEI